MCRYTLLLFLFELRAARLLIRTEFPGQAAGAITRIQVDDDVISLDGMDPLRTETETDINGRVRLRIRRSISSVPDSVVSSSLCLTPRASNLSNAEIFSVNTPNRFFNGGGGSGALQFYNGNNEIMFCNGDLGGFGFTRPGCGVSPRRLSGYASSDAYSLQPTPRASNFNELDVNGAGTPVWMKSPAAGKIYRHAASPKMTWESGQRHVGKDSINGTFSLKDVWLSTDTTPLSRFPLLFSYLKLFISYLLLVCLLFYTIWRIEKTLGGYVKYSFFQIKTCLAYVTFIVQNPRNTNLTNWKTIN